MTDKTLTTIRELLAAEQDLAMNAIADYYDEDSADDIMQWAGRLAAAIHAERDLRRSMTATVVQSLAEQHSNPAERTTEEFLKAADIDSAEHDFIKECLKAAISYCRAQYLDSGIDWMPSASVVGLRDKDKFDMLTVFVENL